METGQLAAEMQESHEDHGHWREYVVVLTAALQEPQEWQQVIGQVIVAELSGTNYLLGNKLLLDNHGVVLSAEQVQYSAEKQSQGETLCIWLLMEAWRPSLPSWTRFGMKRLPLSGN